MSPAADKDRATALSARLPQRLITLDIDGTLFDAWHCCKHRGEGFTGTVECRHLRTDTIEAARKAAKENDAGLVVLSWRGGAEKATRAWLDHVGLTNEILAVFVPGGSDDVATGSRGHGQVGFKVATVAALAALGHQVFVSFDDRDAVCTALTAAGVPDVRQVPHLVTVERHEWVAGYIGAPKHSLLPSRVARSGAGQPALWDEFDLPGRYEAPAYDESEFFDLLDTGEAVYGIDYTIGEDGTIEPLFTADPTTRSLHDLSDDDPFFLDGAADINEACWRAQEADRRLVEQTRNRRSVRKARATR